jgi:hypothetical protein
MEDNRHSPSDEIVNQHPEDIIRQDYEVRVVGGQNVVIPNAFRGLELSLAYTHKPDYLDAVDMPGGVSEYFSVLVSQTHCFFPAPTRHPNPISLILARGNQKAV